MGFPTGTPSYTGFTPGHTLSADSHASQENQQEADIIALSNKVGTGASTPVNQRLLRGNGTGTSAWAQADLTTDITGTLPITNGGTGTTNLSFPTGPDTLVSRTSTDTLANKTLTSPVIASFANATHTHANATGGGQLTGSDALVNSTVTADKLSTGAQSANVLTGETTTSTSYTDLTTTTDAVTVTVGVNGLALISIKADSFSSGAGAINLVTYVASGANSIAASDNNIMSFTSGNGAANEVGSGSAKLLTGLTPGSTTFKMKYRVSANTGTFERRNISVIPL